MNKFVFGVGINDRKYSANVNGKPTKEYDLWCNILRRCYDEKTRHKNITYIDCTVSDNFKNYSYFYEWCNKQVGFDNIKWQIDKDILFKGNKSYSEDTCCFVPPEINKFFTDSRKTRGEYPIGIIFYKRNHKFVARCAVKGKSKFLGHFSTKDEAFQAYKIFKEQRCKILAEKWKPYMNIEVYHSMMNWTVNEQ